jgi:hypothetical protein
MFKFNCLNLLALRLELLMIRHGKKAFFMDCLIRLMHTALRKSPQFSLALCNSGDLRNWCSRIGFKDVIPIVHPYPRVTWVS